MSAAGGFMIEFKNTMALDQLTEGVRDFCVVLDVRELGFSDDQFFRLCRDNERLFIEKSGAGELIIMSPNRTRTGRTQARFLYRVANWAEQDGRGDVYDATSLIKLPNGSMYVPDLSWILKSRWNSLTKEEQNRNAAPICPDFVVEIRSPRDRMKRLKAKMQEYIDNGARLGWLLDTIRNKAYIYRPGEPVQEIDKPEILTGDPVLPGFRFDFREILD